MGIDNWFQKAPPPLGMDATQWLEERSSRARRQSRMKLGICNHDHQGNSHEPPFMLGHLSSLAEQFDAICKTMAVFARS